MSTDPQTILPREFEFLTSECRFKVAESEVAPVFDNAILVLSSSDFDVRFVRDRGDLYVEIRPLSRGEWHDLFLVRLLVLGHDPGENADVKELGDFLRMHYHTVKSLFAQGSEAATTKKLDNLGRERLQRMFPGRVQE